MKRGRKPGRAHGVSGYYGGCRCPECRGASTERQFMYRLEKRLENLRISLRLEPWEVDLERAAMLAKRRES